MLIGVGQHLQRTDRADPELSPAALMTESLRLALTDSGSDSPDALGRSLGWIGAVPALTWRYNDAAREVADSIGADGAITATCAMGGHSPNYLLGAAARAIATGALDVAAITGGEAGRARAAHRATGAQPDWGTQDDDVAPDQMVGPTELEMAHPAEAAHRLYMPTQMYPLFETALRAASGRCIDDHQADVGELWAGFAGVAACNPHAWDRTPYTAAELITPSASNRWVGPTPSTWCQTPAWTWVHRFWWPRPRPPQQQAYPPTAGSSSTPEPMRSIAWRRNGRRLPTHRQ